MCEVVTQFGEMLLAQDLSFLPVWTPGHAGEFYIFRCLFAIKGCSFSVAGEMGSTLFARNEVLQKWTLDWICCAGVCVRPTLLTLLACLREPQESNQVCLTGEAFQSCI
jgi:hypothetical protein